MYEIGSRIRGQPAPPHAVFEALTEFHRDPTRPWLILIEDEQEPEVLQTSSPNFVSWGSIWPHRPHIQVRFEILDDQHGGSDVRWTLLYNDGIIYDASAVGHMRKRMNELINGHLRYAFGQ